MDFLQPVTKIYFADANNNKIAEFYKTLKSKNVGLKISKKEQKINRNYTHTEKKLFTKTLVKAEFSIICNFDEFKDLFNRDLEGIRVGFVNSKKYEKLELYNCNISTEADINFKHDKESTVTFKIEPQGDNGLYFDRLELTTFEADLLTVMLSNDAMTTRTTLNNHMDRNVQLMTELYNELVVASTKL